MGIYVKFWHFLRCPLSKYGHVTWPKKQISKKNLFFPNSAFNIRKSYKISSRKALYFRCYQPKSSRGGGKHPPPPVLLGLSRRVIVRLRLHCAIYRPDSFVLMLRCCANLKAIRYESMSLNRIVADKSLKDKLGLCSLNHAMTCKLREEIRLKRNGVDTYLFRFPLQVAFRKVHTCDSFVRLLWRLCGRERRISRYRTVH